MAPIFLQLDLSELEAYALAQFLKRADRATARRHAGNDREADAIYESWIALREALAAAGYAPR